MSKRVAALALSALLPALLLTAAGCSRTSARYAREARSSYISARAVLAGLQEFPAQAELALRSVDAASTRQVLLEQAEDARSLVAPARSAFSSCREKCELLKGEGDGEYLAYADAMLQLVSLNDQIIDAYSRFIALTASLAESLPYQGSPSQLMPSLERLDGMAGEIEELLSRVVSLEKEAESVYISLGR